MTDNYSLHIESMMKKKTNGNGIKWWTWVSTVSQHMHLVPVNVFSRCYWCWHCYLFIVDEWHGLISADVHISDDHIPATCLSMKSRNTSQNIMLIMQKKKHLYFILCSSFIFLISSLAKFRWLHWQIVYRKVYFACLAHSLVFVSWSAMKLALVQANKISPVNGTNMAVIFGVRYTL